MTGVTADFALVVRRAPPAADPAALPAAQPGLWRRFTAAAAALSRRHIGSAAVSGASTVSEANAALAYEQRYGSGNGYIFGYGEEPYGPYEVEALRTQFGLELPAVREGGGGLGEGRGTRGEACGFGTCGLVQVREEPGRSPRSEGRSGKGRARRGRSHHRCFEYVIMCE
mgnify:CR=1 FL=1